jgi:hypothetical protein
MSENIDRFLLGPGAIFENFGIMGESVFGHHKFLRADWALVLKRNHLCQVSIRAAPDQMARTRLNRWRFDGVSPTRTFASTTAHGRESADHCADDVCNTDRL